MRDNIAKPVVDKLMGALQGQIGAILPDALDGLVGKAGGTKRAERREAKDVKGGERRREERRGNEEEKRGAWANGNHLCTGAPVVLPAL